MMYNTNCNLDKRNNMATKRIKKMKEQAQAIRKELKKAFPKFKFSVTSTYNKVDIHVISGDIDFEHKDLSFNESGLRDYITRDSYIENKDWERRSIDIANTKVKKFSEELLAITNKHINFEYYETGDYGTQPNCYFYVTIGRRACDQYYIYKAA